ncbi:hypothetical protein POM88_019586 [Heracleum sosnowskyi]|uniref:Terpene synthase N-terminal domain-containing protein n=1 Tax=Heracleum sosnowskyi TaxID=360622 RepID=A0AAD8IB72_9APIA|nr:hypothetical protein POM88_019586 [Heracleum sosnowskyi]
MWDWGVRHFELWGAYSKERDTLKNEVRRMLVCAEGEWTEKLILVNTIEWLGVGYHFSEEIEDMLAEMQNAHETSESYKKYDLFTTALFFGILRQHGYKVTSGKPKPCRARKLDSSTRISFDSAIILE